MIPRGWGLRGTPVGQRCPTSRAERGGDNPRARMVGELCASLAAAARGGDLEAARVAHVALGRLLGATTGAGEGAEVVDLAERRGSR